MVITVLDFSEFGQRLNGSVMSSEEEQTTAGWISFSVQELNSSSVKACWLRVVSEQKEPATAKGKSEIRGSLHCATDGETVRRSGRDDASVRCPDDAYVRCPDDACVRCRDDASVRCPDDASCGGI